MKFTQETEFNGYAIHRYGPGEVTLAAPGSLEELTLNEPFLLSGARLDRDWAPGGFEGLDETHLTLLLKDEPELVLLGTGERQRFPAPALLAPLFAAGVGVEVMDSGAACRTYNILLGEGRRVAAGIIL